MNEQQGNEKDCGCEQGEYCTECVPAYSVWVHGKEYKGGLTQNEAMDLADEQMREMRMLPAIEDMQAGVIYSIDTTDCYIAVDDSIYRKIYE